ncbi:MAG: MT-A70 family methyltransferase [Rhizobiaceae bacterium]|nr:MT-A70 family methyltransferase [Rhizobiaceae bacterium]
MSFPDWPFGSLTPLKYGAILADPPWAYTMRSAKGYGKSPEAHYDTMSAGDIAALPVSHLASGDCLLWMWCTWPHLQQGLATMKAWGFSYKTGGSWTKTTATGKRAFGTGYIFRTTTEPFLIGTIGDPAYRSRSIRNLVESERREHSRKPPEARRMIDELLPDVFACELFAREPWPGRDVWGLEADRFAEAEIS